MYLFSDNEPVTVGLFSFKDSNWLMPIIQAHNVRTVVASLDYLSNITGNMHFPALVGEAVIEDMVGLSLRNGLTGLFNHTYFFQQIDLEMRRSVRYGSTVSLMLIDIDDFKEVNNTYGHQEGDRILAAMGETFLHVARDSEICCRYGGEEFALILPVTAIGKAGAIAKRIRNKMRVQLTGGRMVTVSIGVASCGETTRTYRELVEKADIALYKAKRTGKNRVETVVED